MKPLTSIYRTYRLTAPCSRRFLSSTLHRHNALSRNKPKTDRPASTHNSPFTNPNSIHNEIKQEQHRIKYLAISALTCMTIIYILAAQYGKETKAEAPPSSSTRFPKDPKAPIIIERGSTREAPTAGVELVDSGTTSVPSLPKKLYVPLLSDPNKEEEYILIGHGIRTVSFLNIQVYVVGFYIHSDDLPKVQAALIRKIHPTATTATKSEQDQLSNLLTDPERGPALIQEALLEDDDRSIRSLFRIVPTRNTDWSHLRDGWVRGIQSRAPLIAPPQQQQQPPQISDLATSIQSFKQLFQSGLPNTGKSVPKQKTILLVRSLDHEHPRGTLAILYDPTGRNDGKLGNWENEKEKLQVLGQVPDERISRALWLCYLSGKQVASEEARRRVVEGLVGLVSRPVGTIGVEA